MARWAMGLDRWQATLVAYQYLGLSRGVLLPMTLR
jgi:hypothetical protein